MKAKSIKRIMEISKDAEIEVMEVHNLFWESYARRDIELRFSLCSEDITFIGSGLRERALNKTEYKNINKEGVKQFPDPFQIEFLWTNLTMLNENVACVESEVVWTQLINNEMSKELLRNTTLLKYDNNKWLVTHVHGSVPDYRLKEGDYMTNEQTIIRNRELERQVFERTQDLNKTLKELEQKNRELEIETALEKVRSIAMGMREPSDMLDVCKTISIQLESLGVKEIRNVQTAIFYEHRGTYMNYEYYSKHNKTIITETSYTNHKMHTEFALKMLKGKGEFFITHINGKEVKDWIAYQKTTNVFIDEYLETASSVNYYWFSLGAVALGISTYYALADDEINLFKRFLKVFELAYRRFIDIEQAIAQTREAQIELALERVRARTMAMQKSGELAETAYVLFQQFGLLGASPEQLTIAIIDETHKMLEFWLTLGGNQMNRMFRAPINEPIVLNRLYLAWQEQNKSLVIDISGDELKAYYNFYKSLPDYKVFNDFKDSQSPEHRRVIHSAFFSKGWLSVSTPEPRPAEAIQLLERFAAVFDGTYTRFLDLQKAEAQAREAQIEAALERVRSRTMGMQKSEELKEVIKVVYEQFVHLKIHVEHTGFIMDYKARDDMNIWLADKHKVPFQITIPYFDSPHWNSFIEAKEKGSDFFANHLTFEEKNKFYRDLFKLFLVPDEAKEYYFNCSGLAISTVLLENVGLYIENFSGTSYSDEENATLMRFGKVFQQTYTRFNDLKKAEAQAREAQIEVALERVRSKAMAMHGPNDLSETVNVFFKELKILGIIPIRCGVGQIDEVSRTTNLTTTTSSQQGESFQVAGKIKQTGHPVLDGIFDHWKLQKEYHPVLEGEEIKAYYNVMNSQIGYPEYPEGVTQYGNCFFFKEGFVFAWTESKLSEEELQIFRRFTLVLSLTYRRYTDLKEAEARAVEAVKQASLDRVRAEIASMRTTEDLDRITPIIWRELKALDVPFIRCGIYIIDEANAKVQAYLTTPDGKSLGVLNLLFDASELTSNTVECWRKKIVYSEHWTRKQFISWTKSMIEQGQIQNAETYQGSTNPPASLDLHFVPFTQGMLYVGDTSPLAEEKLQLVKTLAEAFSIAYARYEDFKHLEEAKNRIEVTLSELKSAQAQLIHSEKMASLGELTAGIAHEIKNPLNFVNNFSEVSRELLVEMKTELQNKNFEEVIEIMEDLTQNLDKINQHGKRADSIVKGMLLHSRGTSGEKALTNINDLLDQYVNLAYHGLRAHDKEFNITIEKDYDKSLEKINVVPQDISRVFLNIVNNACYAANEKKKMIGNDFSPILKVSTKKLPDKVEIRIMDNGDGIPTSIKEQIFNPFFTTKPTGEGNGLGLSLSYDIVTKVHGGDIKVESEEGKGAEFIIQLPIS